MAILEGRFSMARLREMPHCEEETEFAGHRWEGSQIRRMTC